MDDKASALQDVQTIAALLALGGRRVLDVGCGDGAVARLLASNGCRVWGIERDKALADLARDACESVIVADAEEVDLSELGDGPFDVLLCLDVLQHLIDPVETLRRLTTCLVPDGRVVASLPNVAHGDVRLELLGGAFPFTASELLDRGQLRFFDRRAVEVLISAAGLEIKELLTVMKPPTGLQHDGVTDAWPATVLDALSDPGASITHFVLSAAFAGGDAASRPTFGETVASALLEQQDTIERTAASMRDLEAELAALRAEHQEAQEVHAHVEELERELRERLEELEASYKELAHCELALSGREAYLTELRRTVDELEERDRLREIHLASTERSRDDAEALVETIKGWPAFRIIQRYDEFRQAHPRLVAPARWLTRQINR